MANLAVFASGNGSNFEAIVSSLAGTKHRCALLVCDRRDAFVLERAERLGVRPEFVSYKVRAKEEAEAAIRALLDACDVDFIALAGFMRILSASFTDVWENRLINVHPSILPKYPGIDSIRRAFVAGEAEFGITIHFVDPGVDSGDVIRSFSFLKEEGDTLETVERKVHELEHRHYPEVIRAFLEEYGKD